MFLLLAITIAAALNNPGYACSAWSAVKCATTIKVLECESSCVSNLQSQDCRSCFGETLYDECEPCIAVFGSLLFDAVSFENDDGHTCGAFNWLTCYSDLIDCSDFCGASITANQCAMCLGDNYGGCGSCHAEIAAPHLNQTEVLLGGCSAFQWLKCASTVAGCLSPCSDGITSPQCISCFGSSYDECKGCIGLGNAIETSNSVQDCSIIEWTHCAGALYQCIDPCIERGFTSPQCIRCLGAAGAECFKCVTDDDRNDIDQIAADQRRRRADIVNSGRSHYAIGILTVIAFGIITMLMLL